MRRSDYGLAGDVAVFVPLSGGQFIGATAAGARRGLGGHDLAFLVRRLLWRGRVACLVGGSKGWRWSASSMAIHRSWRDWGWPQPRMLHWSSSSRRF